MPLICARAVTYRNPVASECQVLSLLTGFLASTNYIMLGYLKLIDPSFCMWKTEHHLLM